MSWTLGVDTSSSTLSLGLLHEGTPVLSTSRYVKNSHSEHIAAVIQCFLSLSEIKAKDISHCSVVVGPGSFTGLRIGISFLKGLFANTGTLLLPLSSLECMAESYFIQDGVVETIIDARQDFLFRGQFKRENGKLIRIKDDEKISLEDFLSECDTDSTILFDTAGNIRSNLPASLEKLNAIAFDSLNLPTGLHAALRSKEYEHSDNWQEAINIFPNYMQESYAERMKK